MMNNNLISRLKFSIENIKNQETRIMEVCGTHTRAVSKSGLRHLLPENIKLLSGPGCPVCVTPECYIDNAIKASISENIIFATFGDMFKVRGSSSSLSEQDAEIKVVYSPEDIISIACCNKDKTVVFAAVGFETTAPLIATTVKIAHSKGVNNLLFLTGLKLMEPAIRFILKESKNKINGIICPGHVAAVKGADYFRFITCEYGIPAVVCGFETMDVTEGISVLLEQIGGKKPLAFINLYNRCVKSQGNKKALQIIDEVFDVADGFWRGIGLIKESSLVLNKKYEYMDASKKLGLIIEHNYHAGSCLCKDILMGFTLPYQCPNFGLNCTPENPLGPCMVSSEGACTVHYRYGGYNVYG